MGRPKIKVIDDSVQEEVKEKPRKVKAEGVLPPNAASSRRGAEGDERTRGEAESEPQGVNTEGVVSEQVSGAADQSDQSNEPVQKKVQKPGKAKPRSEQSSRIRSKKYREISKDLDKSQNYPLTEAVELVKKLSYSKFTGTLEAHINTRVSNLRGLVSLPYASGKKLRILAFGKDAAESGVDIIGSNEVIEEINKGKVSFDLVVTTPDWMPKLAKIARILGPRSLMPNPKNGTITNNLKKTVEEFQAGKTEYKTEPKAQVIHLGLGKLDQPTEELSANITTLLQTLGKSRIKKVTISPTQGPSVKLDLSSI